jgi:hypothetical protein
VKKIYHSSIVIIIIIGLLFYQKSKTIGLSITLGMLVPSLFSYLNIMIIDFIMKNYGPEKVNGFNMLQFITKTIFMIGMSFLGIKVLNLKPILYITLLCSTWFIFHISEAFYTQNLFKEKIHNGEKS